VQASLAAAIPLVEKAKEALNALKKEDFQILKTLNNPPTEIKECFLAVQHLFASLDEIIVTDNRGRVKDQDLSGSWKISQKWMAQPEKFMDKLLDYSKYIDDQKVPAQNFKAIKYLIDKPEFNKEELNVKSTAAGGVCDWIRNIYQYYDVVVNVEPMRIAVAEATVKLEEATKKKNEMETLVAELNEKLAKLQAEF